MGLKTLTTACFVAALQGNFSALVLPSSPVYDESVDIYNLNIPLSPAAITYPKSAQEVAGIVSCAAQAGLKVQPKGGGHSWGNFGWGGQNWEVVINLENLDSFSYDPQTEQAKIGSGSLLGDVAQQLHDNGNRSISHGACLSVGIGGHATVGGVGVTSRVFGPTIDHIEEVEMVLANGTIVTASETENPDLLFAVKGAGASFGIVTEFTFRTQPEPTKAVYFSYTFVGTNSTARAQIIQEWQTYILNPSMPREIFPIMAIVQGAIIVQGLHLDTLANFNALAVESAFTATPAATNVTVVDDWMAVVDIFGQLTASGANPTYLYGKNIHVTQDTVIAASTLEDLVEYADTAILDGVSWLIEFQTFGGAINDVATDATAYPHRDALYFVLLHASGAAALSSGTLDFVDGLYDIITSKYPNHEFSAYAGYVDTELVDGPSRYWGSNLPRLESIKAAVDPNDVFHNPQSVKVEESC